MAGKSGLTRRRAMQLAGAALAAPAYIGRAYAARTIKLGFISPETGPIAAFGSADQFIVGEIRKKIGDGLDIGGKKVAIEILVRDSQSNPSRAAELAAELITKDKVDLMLASSTSDTTIAGLRPVRTQQRAVPDDRHALAALVLRSRRRAGQGVRLDLSFLLGRRSGRHHLHRPVEVDRDQQEHRRRLVQ